MPTLKRHARGAAYCRYRGRCYYFGTYGTPESEERFQAWLDQLHDADEPSRHRVGSILSVAAAFMQHGRTHYRKNGVPTGELENVRLSLRKLCELYGNLSADQFGPKLLKSVQQALVADGLSRTTINARVNRIRRLFKWAVSEQLVPVRVWQSLLTVQGLQRGRSAARETSPVEPVAELSIMAVRPHVSDTVWAMILFAWKTGARPGEVVRLK